MNKYFKQSLEAVMLLFCLLASGISLSSTMKEVKDKTGLSLKSAVDMAIKYDPWLQANKHQQDSIESTSIAAGTLPDPKVSIGVANIAAETFQFDQEMMTQFKVGVSQMIPRGDSLAIKQRQLNLMASALPFQREERKAQITIIISQLWLDIYKAQQSIALIEKDRALFEQLADIAQASYASAIGKTRQQDIVRAQLELTRLDDRLTMLKQQKEMRLQKLSEWINHWFGSKYLANVESEMSSKSSLKSDVSRQLPVIKMLFPDSFLDKNTSTVQELSEYLYDHPAILAVEQKIKASKSGIELAKQNYKPAWNLNAGYGYRAEDSSGRERADLFSIGVSFDIPLFTGNRQDKQVRSAIANTSAVKTEKWMMMRKMIASAEIHRSHLNRLMERKTLYNTKLLPQMHDQVEASLTAYTNDDGDFAEVVRSKIAELNAAIDSLVIEVEIQKNIVQLNYYFMKGEQQIVTTQINQTNSVGAIK